MSYVAKVDIGGFKKGDVVPDEKALVWNEMYGVPPTELVVDVPPEEKPAEVHHETTKQEKPKKRRW